MILASIISDLNPIHDAQAIGNDVWHSLANGISHAILDALAAILKATINLVLYGMQHTTPQFAHTKFNPVQPALFSPVWSVMVIVGITLAVLILFIGVISAIIKGETGLLGKQLIFGLIAVMAMASPVPPILAQAIFGEIDFFSHYIMSASLTLAHTTAAAAGQSTIAKITTLLTPGYVPAGGLPVVLFVIIGIIAALASVCVWFELVAREAISYLIMGLFPLALAGLFYKGTSKWLRRAIEGLLAVALGQMIIAVLIAFAMSSLLSAARTISITDFTLFSIFMFLAALGLPIAMRVAPMAFEFGEAALHSSSLASSARGAVANHTTGPAKAALTQRLHAPLVNKISGNNGKPGGRSGGGGSGGRTLRNSLTENIVSAAEIGSAAKSANSNGNGNGNGNGTANSTPGSNIRQQSNNGKSGTGQTPKNSTGTKGTPGSSDGPPEDPPPPPPRRPRPKPPGPPRPPTGSVPA